MAVGRDVQTSRKSNLADQAGSLAIVLREEFASPFRVYDLTSGRPISEAGPGCDGPAPLLDDPAWVAGFAAEERSAVSAIPGGLYRLSLSLHDDDGRPSLVAVGELAALARSPADASQELARLQKWLGSVLERLRLACRSQGRHRTEATRERERDRDRQREGTTSAAWEGILRLEHLLRSLRIDKEPTRNRKRILHAVSELIGVQAVAWVPNRNDEPVVLEGERLLSAWDFSQLGAMLAQTPDWEAHGYLIRNDLAAVGWASRFPHVANILAMPVTDRGLSGWVIALNKRGLQPAVLDHGDTRDGTADADGSEDLSASSVVPFRRVDAALLTPFAALAGSLARASQGYDRLKNLLVGLTRSLTAAIDAKDSYTFGHSERVARVAVELGRELGLQEDELSDIYLAGLLHDIGKIGIRDSVLCKRDTLTAEEFEHIKDHVRIGYRILADLRPIAHLLPGVLYHHEQFDGSGYPEGLKGNAIPLLARILAVADGYDAMTTSRPYRDSLPPAQVEATLIEGAGTQWDRIVVEAFLQCKERIHAVRQRGVGESLCNALDDALRKGADGAETSSRSVLPS